MFYDSMPLSEARQIVLEERFSKDGIGCPCCLTLAKVYQRRIHGTMARTLITMYRHGGADGYVHTASLPGDTHEASQLSWWHLIEEEKIRRPDGGRAGWWRITHIGVNWVLARSYIPKYARIYDSEVLDLTGEPVTIQDALGKRFNYRELMEGR